MVVVCVWAEEQIEKREEQKKTGSLSPLSLQFRFLFCGVRYRQES